MTGDVGGQKTLRSYWRNYFEKTDALIWVVDATDRLRIDDCREELHGLLQEERLAGASLLIFANKTDVQGCMDEAEILEGLQLKTIRTHQWHVLRCSAMTGENLEEGLAWVVEDAKASPPSLPSAAAAFVPMSEDVSRFLSQVKELGERRIEEDEARSRELEEKILQDRKERQARRRERARSISPQKSSPANTPSPSHLSDLHRSERLDLVTSPILNPPSSPQSQLQSPPNTEEDSMATGAPLSTSPSKENDSPLDAEIKPNYPPSPTRSGTTARGLSWQRRPNSQASERSRSRPLSVVAAENATRSSNPASEQDLASDNPSRDQIAAALSSKDPSWFRQTADRGANSAAYRRNQVEDTQTVDLSSAQTQLPGMSRSTSGESFRNGDNSLRESASLRSSVTSPTNLLSAQRLDPPSNTTQSDVDSTRETRSPFSPPPRPDVAYEDRKTYFPNKSKRWNVQSPAGLQRADPVVSNRNSYDPTSRTIARSKIRPTSIMGDTPTESARPSSSEGKEEDRSASRISAPLKLDTTTSSEAQAQDSGKTTPPVSPSKTMDPRRWSPQKSSWLESALNKPESPKPKSTQPPPNQPAWMAELQKAKAQKASNPGTESSKAPVVSHKHQVSIGGLLRSSAPGITTAPVARGSLHSPSPSIGTTNNPTSNVKPSEAQPSTVPSLAKSKSEPTGEIKQAALPSASKVKPATPPKKDFRASLKPRAPPTTTSTGSQNVEFKNVFGTLRKTTTQNYVAPDELKDNITRGKAALTVTGGPQKSERVDEFKEAILAKKKEFQAAQSEGRSVPRNNSVASENPVPEGLLKRAELGRNNTIKRDPTTSDVPSTDTRRPSNFSQRDSVAGSFAGRFERFGTLEKRASVTEAPNSRPEGQSTSTEPSSIRKFPVPRPASGSPDQANETNGSTRLPGKIGGSVLANRFNPALAGLLSRGPPPIASNTAAKFGGTLASGSKTDDNEAGSGPKLTHMTKNRARGPKRKAPTRSSALPTTTTDSKPSATIKPSMGGSTEDRKNGTPSPRPSLINLIDSSKKESVAPIQPRPKPISLGSASKLVNESTASGGATIEQSRPESKILGQIATFATQGQQPTAGKTSDASQQISPRSPSPGKLNMNRISRFMDDAANTDKGSDPEQPKPFEAPLRTKSFPAKIATQDAEQQAQPRSPSLNKPKVPLPTPLSLPTKRQAPNNEVGAIGTEPGNKIVAPLGPRPLPQPPVIAASESSDLPARPLPEEPERAPRPLPSPGLKPTAEAASPIRSPSKPSLDTSDMLRDFFGPDRPQRNYRVDAAELLTHRPDLTPPKIQTLSAQLFQFSADGKKQPVPTHRERTLFEREMYICTHTFNDEAGKKTSEVYFWAGGEVPEPTVEDAAVFVAREARSFGGTLIKLRQGKETPEFLQALGGIVITQRGSGNKYDSLAPHMLCGRRYHGHVVFDEVDFTSSALCSGFPYLITQSGRCYLWKGKGSSVDELSCARLIGMDYALSGEMEEVEEGREPTTFWDLFDGANRFGSADHWRLKPTYDKYSSRLFLSDADSKRQIMEFSMFTQTDLLPTNIYVIDAFFELYIVVGSRAQTQYASFHNALDFAQEYAILAASVEDRPFVPVSTVVLEGIPRDMKSVFRKWQDTLSPTVTNPNTGLKRGRSLKVVSLGQALQALSD
ncbi:hypothetical protein O1611_g2067 [Lasiodiplodia mahajangana]|uniref:Uncharacterized protein n=1 Tax=Lasiodiplodia mahajangana TaxID=1108764 RepID=A0ACC2JW63_9PEZI|nr:hypothetical protein O1611_g2067 [Lasiodiplodia mahajangana]